MDEPNKNSSAFDVNIRLIKICNIYMKIIKWKSLLDIWRLEYSFLFLSVRPLQYLSRKSSIIGSRRIGCMWIWVALSDYFSIPWFHIFFFSAHIISIFGKKKSRQINQQFTNCTTIEWNVSNHGDSWMADIWNWKYWIFFLHLFNVIRCWALEMAFAHESCKWKNVRVSRIISIELKKISAHIKCLCRFDFAGIFEAYPSKIHTHVFLWCNGVLY